MFSRLNQQTRAVAGSPVSPPIVKGEQGRLTSRKCMQVKVQPKEVLFRNGEDSQSGIFIVVEGGLGVYLDEGDELRLTNILRTGESVGDLDVLDGKPLTVLARHRVAKA